MTGNAALVEAGGQNVRGFRCGLDYAFIRSCPLLDTRGCGACYPVRYFNRILVPARRWQRFGESMSLYRANLKLAFSSPLGVAMPPSRDDAVRFHRCELRYHSTLSG